MKRSTSKTLILFLVTVQLCLAIGAAQNPQTKKAVNLGKIQAKSAVPAPPPQTMPNVKTGAFTFEAASDLLKRQFNQERISRVDTSCSFPAGIVCNQDPDPGTLLDSRTRITLQVSTGPAPVQPVNDTVDLSVTKTLVKKPEYRPRDLVQYSIVVTNLGQVTATKVQVTDIPTNLTDPTFTSTSAKCISNTCSIDQIEANRSVQINVTATIAASGTFTNVAATAAAQLDSNPTNNSSEARAEAIPSADLSAEQRLDPVGPYRVGQSVQYTIHITNGGPSDATNITIDDTLSNLTIKNVSGDCTNFPCTISKLARDAVATIIVAASIDREGAFQNAAVIRAAEDDRNTANNNIPELGGVASSFAAPPTPPPTSDFPPWWLVVVLVGVGSGVAGGGTYAIWQHLKNGRPRPPVQTNPSPALPPQSDPSPQPPPTPVVQADVDLKTGTPTIDGLQITGPQIRLRTSLEVGTSTFDGPVPIVRRKVVK